MRLKFAAGAIVLASAGAVLMPSIASAEYYYQRYCETKYRNVRIPYQDQVCYEGGYGYGGGGCRYVTKYRYDRQPYEYCYNKRYYRQGYGGGGYGGGGNYGGGGY